MLPSPKASGGLGMIAPYVLFLAMVASATEADRKKSGKTDFCGHLSSLVEGLRSFQPELSGKQTTFSAIEKDGRYGLPLTDFWTLLAECSVKENNPRLDIQPIPDLPGPTPLKAYLKARKGKDSPPRVKWRMHSPCLAGVLQVERWPGFRVGLEVHVLGSLGETVFTDTLADIGILQAHAGLSQTLFSRISGKKGMELGESHQVAVERLESALYGGGTPPFLPGDTFQFETGWSQEHSQPLSSLKEILTLHFGFIPAAKSDRTIRLKPDGSMTFETRGGGRVRIDSVLSSPSMLKGGRAWGVDSYTVLRSAATNEAPTGMTFNGGRRNFDTLIIPFSKATDRFPNLGPAIRREIDSNWARSYGQNLGPPDFNYLGRIFQGKEAKILRGQLLSMEPGSEKVRYYWESAESYLAGLRRKVELGERFIVELDLLRLYQDKANSRRFWGIVFQSWDTRDLKGKIRYRDDGILFVNFDFTPAKERLDNFRIFYRFWFHNYRTDAWRTEKDGRKVRVPPSERIASVITAAIDASQPVPPRVEFSSWSDKENRFRLDTLARGISGVDRDLLVLMRDDLLDLMR